MTLGSAAADTSVNGEQRDHGQWRTEVRNVCSVCFRSRKERGAYQRNGFSALFTVQHNESPGVSLQGGKTGFDLVPWELLLDPSAENLFTPAELQTLQSEVLASPRTARAAIPAVSCTLNLDASLREGLSVKDPKLMIKASLSLFLLPSCDLHSAIVFAYTLNFLSAGSLAPMKGTHHEHSGKKISDTFESGYGASYASWREAVVELASKRSKLRFTFGANRGAESEVQFYTNNFSRPEKTARQKIHAGLGAQGDRLRRRM
ncbi:hypothetical protein B0H21DRAFT_838106 [Amylocystis lapponica]|nr:hypothetical protein B0H21DRAFT_838106 [Amylocystis lapponica]